MECQFVFISHFNGNKSLKISISKKLAHDSVTRFGEILPLWQKFRNLGNILKVHLVLGKVVNQLWHYLYAYVQIFITVNGQEVKKES